MKIEEFQFWATKHDIKEVIVEDEKKPYYRKPKGGNLGAMFGPTGMRRTGNRVYIFLAPSLTQARVTVNKNKEIIRLDGLLVEEYQV